MLTASLSMKRFMKVMNSSLPPNLKQSAVFVKHFKNSEHKNKLHRKRSKYTRSQKECYFNWTVQREGNLGLLMPQSTIKQDLLCVI